MSTQFKAGMLKAAAATFVALGLAMAAIPARAESTSGELVSVGSVIALQGNAALAEIRKQARRSKPKLMPLPPYAAPAKSDETAEPAGDPGQIWIPRNQLVCLTD